MYLTSLEIHGLRHVDGLVMPDLGQVVLLPPPPVGVAVADALTLVRATLEAGATEDALRRLAVIGPDEEVDLVREGGFVVQAAWSDPTGIAALVDPEAGRRLTVEVGLHLDPPLYGRLRELAVREPRLVTALGQGPSLGVKVGWLFTRDLCTASLSLLQVRVGQSAFPTGGDRPGWLSAILPTVGGRFGRLDWQEGVHSIGTRLLEAALGPDPERRAAVGRTSEALAGPPFSLGELELVRLGDQVLPCFGKELTRVRQLGSAALAALRLVSAVCVDAPDVLVVEEAWDEGVRDWLEACTTGEAATLEQVVLVPGRAG